MRKRRNIEAFSLSFLDCICCGFGAVVLLLVLSKLYDPNLVSLDQTSDEVIISLSHIDHDKDELIADYSKNNIKKEVTEKKIDLDILQY